MSWSIKATLNSLDTQIFVYSIMGPMPISSWINLQASIFLKNSFRIDQWNLAFTVYFKCFDICKLFNRFWTGLAEQIQLRILQCCNEATIWFHIRSCNSLLCKLALPFIELDLNFTLDHRVQVQVDKVPFNGRALYIYFQLDYTWQLFDNPRTPGQLTLRGEISLSTSGTSGGPV